MRDGGKGDKPRPIKDREQFDKNWDEIFKKDKDEQSTNGNGNTERNSRDTISAGRRD